MTETSDNSTDLSDLLYISGKTHPGPAAHPIVVVSLPALGAIWPSVSDDQLFELALKNLDPYVGEEGKGGYVLVVLAAEEDDSEDISVGNDIKKTSGKGKGRSKPGVAWWIWRWKRVPRRYRKNLKRLYLVHPSSFTQTIVPLILPFLSPKAYSKFYPLPSLFQLTKEHGMPLQGIRMPMAVLDEESRYRQHQPSTSSATHHTTTPTWTASVTAAVGVVGAYFPFSGLMSSKTGAAPTQDTTKRGYWGRDMDELVEECGSEGLPLLRELSEAILGECMTTEGVFRRTPGTHLRAVLVDLLDLPLTSQPILPWREIARSDPLLPPKLVSRLLSSSAAPIIRSDQYNLVRRSETADDIRKILLSALSPGTRKVLTDVVSILHQVSKHASETRMTPLNLAICIAPDLIRGPDALEDASLCLEPGKKLPMQMLAGRAGGSDEGKGTLVGVLEIWIRDYERI